MSNPLIDSRDAFAASHPEQRIDLNGREWGLVEVGSGPVLLLIPGTLGPRRYLLATDHGTQGPDAHPRRDLSQHRRRRRLERRSGHADGSHGRGAGNRTGIVAGWISGAVSCGRCTFRVTRLIGANTLCSVKGLDQRMPYALDLMNAPIADLRAGFGRDLAPGRPHIRSRQTWWRC
jgi:maspardin